MKTIDGHTFDETRIGDGWVIDAGCRGWNFTNYFKGKVYALDIEYFPVELSTEFGPEHLIFNHAGLSHKPGKKNAYYFGNGTGNFIEGINEVPYNGPDRPCETKEVKLITLEDIYNEIGDEIDLLKLDIEGSEYDVLLGMREPTPRQITCEFHEHTVPLLHIKYIPELLEKMSKWYHIAFFQVEPRYQMLDVLFTRKDL